MESGDRDQLMHDIRSGMRLRPTKTVDKSKPVILVEGETLKSVAKPVATVQNGIPAPPPPPPPPSLAMQSKFPLPPPNLGLQNSKSSAKAKPREENQQAQPDRDALMQAIRQGVALRKVKEKKEEINQFESKPLFQTENSRSISISSLSTTSTTGDECAPKKDVGVRTAQKLPAKVESPLFERSTVFPAKSNDSIIDRLEMSSKSGLMEYGKDECTVRKWSPPQNLNLRQGQGHVGKSKTPSPIKSPLSSAKSIDSLIGRFNGQNGKSDDNGAAIVPQKENEDEPIQKKWSVPNAAVSCSTNLIRPQKLPLSQHNQLDRSKFAKSDDGSPPGKNGEFALNGLVNGAKMIWERRASENESNVQPQCNSKSPSTPVLRHFNGPDYPESIGSLPTPTGHRPEPKTFQKSLPSRPPASQTTPIAVDTTLTWESETSKTHRPLKQQKSLVHRNRSGSIGSLGDDHCDRVPVQPKSVATTRPAERFLPDVLALKQRFEEKAEENGRPIKTSGQQSQQAVSVSNASSGYSSGSPSPKSAENGKAGRFPYQTNSEGHRRNRSGSVTDFGKSIDRSAQMKAETVKKDVGHPNLDRARVSNSLANGDGTVKKVRNYYRTNSSSKPSHPNAEAHQNGNANGTATWIVKKGNISNIVNKYAVCEHLEALHQRKVNSNTNTSSSGSIFDGDLDESSKSSGSIKCMDEIDDDVGKFLGVPVDLLKELRFSIDVDDPAGSLLRIQKRYNEFS